MGGARWTTDDGSAGIGWYVRPAQWGKGYATDATQLLLQFGFERLDRTRIIATSDPENLAANRVLEKAGLRREADDLTVDTWRGPDRASSTPSRTRHGDPPVPT